MISVLMVSACTIGKSGKDLAVASHPGGAQVTLLSKDRHFTGELVAVRDDGVVVSVQNRLLFFPFASLGGFAFGKGNRGYRLSPGERPPRDKLSRLRTISHFPQGLTPEIERQLLAQMGQTAIVTIE